MVKILGFDFVFFIMKETKFLLFVSFLRSVDNRSVAFAFQIVDMKPRLFLSTVDILLRSAA